MTARGYKYNAFTDRRSIPHTYVRLPTMSETVESVDEPKTKLVLHHLNNSRAQRILWLLEELEVPYEIKTYRRQANGLVPKELKALHPLGKSPVVVDGDVMVAESGAIIDYIAKKYGGEKLQATEAGWLDNTYFSQYAEGSLIPVLAVRLMLSMIPAQTPFLLRIFARLICGGVISRLVDPQIKRHVAFIEEHLEKTPGDWFAASGRPTKADFLMIFPLEAMAKSADFATEGPRIKAYVDRVHARPAYKRALEIGGPYAFA